LREYRLHTNVQATDTAVQRFARFMINVRRQTEFLFLRAERKLDRSSDHAQHR
jgi:hypothetical protein